MREIPAVLAAACCLAGPVIAGAQTATPPIAPKIQEPPLPPPVTLPAPPTVPSDVPNRPLTADEAAQIALYHQPSVTNAVAGITAAQGVTQQVRAGLLPTLGVNFGYTGEHQIAGPSGSSSGSRSSTTIPWSGTAEVRQLIFDFNHTRDLVRQAEMQEQVAGANLTAVESTLVLQVKQAFYTLMQDLRLVSVNETNVRDQQAQRDLAQARLKAGIGLPSDVVQAETALAQAIFNLNQAQNTASIARVNLATLMGIDPRTPIDVANSGEPAVNTDNVNALVQDALRQRPEVLQAQANLRSTQFGLGAARTTNAPAFSGFVGGTTVGTSFPPKDDFFIYGVSVSWDPFDAGLTAGRVKQAQADVTIAQANLTNAQLAVTSDVSQSYLNLRTAEQRVTTAQAEVANAQESVRLMTGRYRAGVGTFLDVITAQAALVTAQTDLVNAQSAVDQARAAVLHAIGAPLPLVAPAAPRSSQPAPITPAPTAPAIQTVPTPYGTTAATPSPSTAPPAANPPAATSGTKRTRK
ncbi:MAG TPA: TolC family protein [Chthonomonadaceae bacterium]|nr:TolC family protein [Chthonomonadaceae bacterium]